MRNDVIDILEKHVTENIRGFAEDPELVDYIEEQFHELSRQFDNSAEKKEAAETLNEMQALVKLTEYIAGVKGDAAHPALKETAKVLFKLSDEDYNKDYKIIRAMVQGYNASLNPSPSKGPKRHWKL
ncbi:MAG: hypothetical protein KGH73_06135 [Xanthomonadaceae bacterium]|nr:hypothetical protein [Xanthomonadaceae bacterium]